MTREEFMANLWRWSCEVPEKETGPLPPLGALAGSEWSREFERLMRNRLIMGGIRYGLLNAGGKPQYDRVRAAIKRLEAYAETGNLELLVDAANLCLLEFEEGRHPLRHFAAADDAAHVERREA